MCFSGSESPTQRSKPIATNPKTKHPTQTPARHTAAQIISAPMGVEMADVCAGPHLLVHQQEPGHPRARHRRTAPGCMTSSKFVAQPRAQVWFGFAWFVSRGLLLPGGSVGGGVLFPLACSPLRAFFSRLGAWTGLVMCVAAPKLFFRGFLCVCCLPARGAPRHTALWNQNGTPIPDAPEPVANWGFCSVFWERSQLPFLHIVGVPLCAFRGPRVLLDA